MDVSIIIINYNTKEITECCIKSILSNTKSINYEIILVDNASSDGSVDFFCDYNNINFIRSKENLGFGKANNIGFEKALEEKYDYAFLLNQDAWVQHETIAKLIYFSENNKEYGIISPLHLNGIGDTIDPKFGAALMSQNSNYLNDLLFNKTAKVYDVKFVNAAVWLVPKRILLEIGGFNPFYFMYGEDGDYCKRILFHENKIGVLPNSFAHHARDNHYYKKKKTFYKNLVFHTNEWYQWSYEEFLVFENTTFQGIYKSLNKVLIISINALFRKQISKHIGTILGWFFFLLSLNKIIKDKKKMMNLKSSHFL